MSVATPSTLVQVPSGSTSGTLIVLNQRTSPVASVTGSSGISFSRRETMTSRSSATNWATSSLFALKSASLRPTTSFTVVP